MDALLAQWGRQSGYVSLRINKTKPFQWFDASLQEPPDPTIRNNLSLNFIWNEG
jgi:hypothetical protein